MTKKGLAPPDDRGRTEGPLLHGHDVTITEEACLGILKGVAEQLKNDDRQKWGKDFPPDPQHQFCLFNSQFTNVLVHRGMLPRLPSLLVWQYLSLAELGRASMAAKKMLLIRCSLDKIRKVGIWWEGWHRERGLVESTRPGPGKKGLTFSAGPNVEELISEKKRDHRSRGLGPKITAGPQAQGLQAQDHVEKDSDSDCESMGGLCGSSDSDYNENDLTEDSESDDDDAGTLLFHSRTNKRKQMFFQSGHAKRIGEKGMQEGMHFTASQFPDNGIFPEYVKTAVIPGRGRVPMGSAGPGLHRRSVLPGDLGAWKPGESNYPEKIAK